MRFYAREKGIPSIFCYMAKKRTPQRIIGILSELLRTRNVGVRGTERSAWTDGKGDITSYAVGGMTGGILGGNTYIYNKLFGKYSDSDVKNVETSGQNVAKTEEYAYNVEKEAVREAAEP